MNTNPVLRKLGLSDNDRLVILHTDDIGMCQATVSAFADLMDFGLISSGAVMVPCPWFLSVAAYCRQHLGIDLGVHLTLNSEWDNYRWGPISTCDPASGLLDQEGYFYHWPNQTQEYADPSVVQVEVEAQVARAIQSGIDVTHVDTHMGTVAYPKFSAAYIQTALKYHLPAMILRGDVSAFERLGLDRDNATLIAQFVQTLEDQGIPTFDHVEGLPLDQSDDRVAYIKQRLNQLPPGLTHFLCHPAADTPELRAIAPDWRSRVADYQAFTSEELRTWVRASSIQVIGYRALRQIMRNGSSHPPKAES